MTFAGDIDAFELSRPDPALDADEDTRRGHVGGLQLEAAPRRWWFVFDGWRRADVEPELVFA